MHERFSECCDVDSDDDRPLCPWPLKSDLYKTYKAWAEEAGYDKFKLVSPLGFKRILETIDGVSIRASDGVRVVGAKVKPGWERCADKDYPRF